MKPLKVLLLITKGNWGGAQRYVYDLATGLPKDSFSVEVMTGSEGILNQKLSAAGIYTSELEISNTLGLKKAVSEVFRLVSVFKAKKCDIVHLNSSKVGVVGAIAARLAGVKRTIFTVHGWAFNEERPLQQKLFMKLMYFTALALVDEVIVVSQAARDQVRHWPWVQGKIVVVKNGIAPVVGYSRANARLELTRMNEKVQKAVEGRSESSLVWIGTVAELHHIKGHRYGIRAIADAIESYERANPSKKIIYTIVGEGEEREVLQKMIDGLKLSDRIILMGRVDGAAQYLKAFDIFLLASLSEALAYVILEAGLASLPVIATAVGGIPEVVDDMNSGILVQPRNSRDLAHALSFVIEHPKEAREYGTHLREKVLRDFSVSKMLEKTRKIYTK